jgi:hypothetical protein
MSVDSGLIQAVLTFLALELPAIAYVRENLITESEGSTSISFAIATSGIAAILCLSSVSVIAYANQGSHSLASTVGVFLFISSAVVALLSVFGIGYRIYKEGGNDDDIGDDDDGDSDPEPE